jgi:hypothetical protein
MKPKALSSSPRAELRAIKWFTLTHALGLLLFAALLGGFFWYVHRVEQLQQRQALYRNVEWAQQSLRLKLRENRDEIMASALDWAASETTVPDLRSRAQDFLARNPEALYIARLDADRRVAWVMPGRGVLTVPHREPGERADDSAGFAAFHEARDELRTVYTNPFVDNDSQLMVELHGPLVHKGEFLGTVAVGYSLSRLLTQTLPHDVRERYHFSINDRGGNTLVSTSPRSVHEADLGYDLPLDPPAHGMRLQGFAFDTQPHLAERLLLLAVVALSIASIVSLALMWRHARRRLAAEAERDRLFRLSQDLICVLDAHGRFVRVNPAFEALFGPPAAVSGLPQLVHSDDLAATLAALAEAASGQAAAASFEARFETPLGQRWLRWSLRGDHEVSPPTLYAIAHDITARKQVETALAAETAFRAAMEESMLTGMRAIDVEGRITYVNRAFCEMVGYPAEQLIGVNSPYPYWPPDEVDLHAENLRRVLAGEAQSGGFEVCVRRGDGSRFDARMYVSPLVDREGRQTGWMTSMTDITEPKRIREELAAAHERFTTVLDELEAAVWVLPGESSASDERAPLFTNLAFRQLFASADDHADLLAALEPLGPAWLPREVWLPQQGRWFEVRKRRIRWVDGSPVRMFVASDVTRRHEAEARHREQEHELQRTSRLVTMGEMASSLAHELNQPLTAITNYCMGLSARVRGRAARGEPADERELLETLAKTSAQAERAGKVIRRIREFVKRSEPERQPCEVRAIVGDALGLAEIDAQRLGVRIDVRLADDLPSLHADPILIEQVLLNLVKNGIDAMRESPRRTLRVDVRRVDLAIEFSVADAGPGLTAEARERLFEPFFTTKREGMGIGLNICRSIVESHQGRLWVESNPSGGCTFRFTLPEPASPAVARAA